MNTYAHVNGELVVSHRYNQYMATTDEYTDHVHPGYEMFYFIKGDIEYIVENRRYVLRPYDLLLIRPNEHHRFRIMSEKEYERMVVFFPDRIIPPAAVPYIREKGTLYSIGDTELAAHLRRADELAARFSGDMLSVVMESWFNELMVRFACFERDAEQHQSTNGGLDAVVEYITANLSQPVNIDDLCRRFGMSRSYLFKAFTECFHEPPKQYIIRRKIMFAQQLIIGGERPISVCEKCGFSDYSTFYRAYLRVTGTTPSGHEHRNE